MKEVLTRKLVSLSVIALAVLLIASMGLVLVWVYQSPNVLAVYNTPFPVRTIHTNTTPDGVVILTLDYCKKIDVNGSLRVSFVSATREELLPVAPERGPVGCNHDVEVPIVVPIDLTPDTYHIHFRSTYRINPFRTVTEEFDSKSFKVVSNGQSE